MEEAIEYNKLNAILRLANCKAGVKLRELNVGGIKIYNIEEWPLCILRILFSDNFKHEHRFSLALFMYQRRRYQHF